jgi:hypothetical protein
MRSAHACTCTEFNVMRVTSTHTRILVLYTASIRVRTDGSTETLYMTICPYEGDEYYNFSINDTKSNRHNPIGCSLLLSICVLQVTFIPAYLSV